MRNVSDKFVSKIKTHIITFICDKSITIQNLAFLGYWYRKKVYRCAFNRYSVLTQFAKLAARKQLCRRCTHRKL